MADLRGVLWPIIAFGASGAFIDFLLGKAGQKRLKDKMEEAWYRFHEINWHNFGQKESEYYLALTDRILGRKFFGVKRWVCTIVVSLSVAFISGLWSSKLTWIPTDFGYILYFGYVFSEPDFVELTTEAILFAISLSITRRIAQITISLATKRIFGPLPFVFMLMCQYILLVTWLPLISIPLTVLASNIGAHADERFGLIGTYLESEVAMFSFGSVFWAPLSDWMAYLSGALRTERATPPQLYGEAPSLALVAANIRQMVETTIFGLLINGMRVSFALLLLTSFIIREWVGRLLSLVWARLIESERPVFTILLGGIGGIASLINVLLSHTN